MKKLLGTDIAGSWVFVPDSAGASTITFSGIGLDLRQILLINNSTRNEVIYNFADVSAGAFAYARITDTTSELTLNYDTSAHDASDDLTIYVDVDEPVSVDAAPQGVVANMLVRILNLLAAPLGYSKDIQRYRNTAIVESGTVTTVSTLTTVTNPVPVGNVATLGSLAADRLINSANMSAWAAAHRSRIT